MSDLPPPVSLALLVGTIAALTWIFAETARRMTVRGSRDRYIWASVERATRYPAGMYLSISAVIEFRLGTPLMALIDCTGAALWLFVLSQKKRDGNDDDFWTDCKKRLAQWKAGPATASGAA